MSDLKLLPAAIALGAVCIANYTDLRERIISNRLTFPLIGTGMIFYLLLGIWLRDPWTTVSGLVGAVIAFVIGYAMWLTGGWAGGDVKLFTALGALLPGMGQSFSPPNLAPYPLPITILFNSVVAVLPILLVYAVYCRLRGHSVLYEQAKITELKEGMIPAELIYEKNGEVKRWSSKFRLRPSYDRIYANPSRAAGLTRYQVGALKRLVRTRKLKNSIRIKRGMPFAPALALGVFITVFHGDLYWQFISVLSGG